MTNEDHDAEVATFAEAEARAKWLHECPEERNRLEYLRDTPPCIGITSRSAFGQLACRKRWAASAINHGKMRQWSAPSRWKEHPHGTPPLHPQVRSKVYFLRL